MTQPEALRLADELEHTSFIYPREQAAAELRRLHDVNQELVEALGTINHSVKQAQISGNDWRRELKLCENITDQALAKARGTE